MTHPPLEPSPLSDLEIARRAHLEPILGLAEARLGLAAEELVPFGHHRAKLSRGLLERLRGGRLRQADDPARAPPGARRAGHGAGQCGGDHRPRLRRDRATADIRPPR